MPTFIILAILTTLLQPTKESRVKEMWNKHVYSDIKKGSDIQSQLLKKWKNRLWYLTAVLKKFKKILQFVKPVLWVFEITRTGHY